LEHDTPLSDTQLSDTLNPTTLTRISRLDFTNVALTENDTNNTNKDSYNWKTGRLVLIPTKTRDNYSYDYKMNKIVQKNLKINIENKPRTKMFNLTKTNFGNLAQSALRIGNKRYRQLW
jgi:hypothetical protein